MREMFKQRHGEPVHAGIDECQASRNQKPAMLTVASQHSGDQYHVDAYKWLVQSEDLHEQD